MNKIKKETIYPNDWEQRQKDYNDMVDRLAQQRKDFYEKNPDYPIKTMYINVIAPPKKIIIRTI